MGSRRDLSIAEKALIIKYRSEKRTLQEIASILYNNFV